MFKTRKIVMGVVLLLLVGLFIFVKNEITNKETPYLVKEIPNAKTITINNNVSDEEIINAVYEDIEKHLPTEEMNNFCEEECIDNEGCYSYTVTIDKDYGYEYNYTCIGYDNNINVLFEKIINK